VNQPTHCYQSLESSPRKVRRWRQLGYSELLWIKYQE
jgi:hypothetical protein